MQTQKIGYLNNQTYIAVTVSMGARISDTLKDTKKVAVENNQPVVFYFSGVLMVVCANSDIDLIQEKFLARGSSQEFAVISDTD